MPLENASQVGRFPQHSVWGSGGSGAQALQFGEAGFSQKSAEPAEAD